MKIMLYGTGDQEPQTDLTAQLAQEMYNADMLTFEIENLSRIDFEGKKDVAQIFNNLLRRQIGTRSPTVEHICTRPKILFTLMKGSVLVYSLNTTTQLKHMWVTYRLPAIIRFT